MSTASWQSDAFHIESHQALLRQPAEAGLDGLEARRHLDAIVVPTIRPHSLGRAIALAGDVGCALVVLCSTAEQVARAAQECSPLGGDVLVTYVPPSAPEILPALQTSRHRQIDVVASGHADIARKRNVGLLLARMCDWRTIMFLDDDIRALTASAVNAAAALTGHFQAVGFKINHYPDNSVVCHAHRLAGGTQDVFPGGSALVVDVFQSDTMFPPIYNEDWLFLFDAAQRRSVALAGTLSQLEYRPFARPDRAASEEFGDVIAEGLYRLLHEGRDVIDAKLDYWQDTLQRRFRLIDHIARELPLRRKDEPVAEHALKSLVGARTRLAEITKQDCLSFIQSWCTDIDAWRKQLTGLPLLADLAGAAKYLCLPTLNRDVSKAMRRYKIIIDSTAQIAPTAVIDSPFRPLVDGRQLHVDRDTVITAGVWVGQFATVGQGVTIGAKSLVEDFVSIQARSEIGERVVLVTHTWIGIGATVGDDSVIRGHVGDSARVGARCRVAGNLIHRQLDPSLGWDDPDSEEPAPIVEDGAFIGWGAVIVGGVNIGAGAYVCAGALVTRDVPAGHIACGRNQIMHPSEWSGALAKSPFFHDAPNG